jgi:hypothetical protein
MPSMYRKAPGEDTWHFCYNCSDWPTINYIELPAAPKTGELCNECEAKRRQGNCRSEDME